MAAEYRQSADAGTAAPSPSPAFYQKAWPNDVRCGSGARRWTRRVHVGPIKTPAEFRTAYALDWICSGAAVAVAAACAGRVVGIGVGLWTVMLVVLVRVLARRVLIPRGYARLPAALSGIVFRVCPGCHYDLHTLPADGQCPECGETFDPTALEQEWRDLPDPVKRF